MVERPKVRKIVEMFDSLGRPVDDPAKAARTVTTYTEEDGTVTRKVRGKMIIIGKEEQED